MSTYTTYHDSTSTITTYTNDSSVISGVDNISTGSSTLYTEIEIGGVVYRTPFLHTSSSSITTAVSFNHPINYDDFVPSYDEEDNEKGVPFSLIREINNELNSLND